MLPGLVRAGSGRTAVRPYNNHAATDAAMTSNDDHTMGRGAQRAPKGREEECKPTIPR